MKGRIIPLRRLPPAAALAPFVRTYEERNSEIRGNRMLRPNDPAEDLEKSRIFDALPEALAKKSKISRPNVFAAHECLNGN